MRVRMQVRSDGSNKAGTGMGERQRRAISEPSGEALSTGVVVVREWALAASRGLRVHDTCERRIVTDGPFVETKELFGD